MSINNPSRDSMEQIKQIMQDMINSRQYVLEGIVTSVDPKPPYKVKVRLEPQGVETGWMKIAMPYAGAGFGFVLPPFDEGTPVKVIFDLGNLNSGTVIGAVFNQNVTMPNVPVGSAGIVHKSGSKIMIAPDGLVTITGKNLSQSW